MLSSEDFGASFQAFIQQMTGQGAREEPVLLRRLREHFGCDPSTLPIVSESLERFDHPNLHLAVESCLADDGRSAELLGVKKPSPQLRGHPALTPCQLICGHGDGRPSSRAPKTMRPSQDAEATIECSRLGFPGSIGYTYQADGRKWEASGALHNPRAAASRCRRGRALVSKGES